MHGAGEDSEMQKKETTIGPACPADREELLRLYQSQVGREFCPWDEEYPSMENIDDDLSRDALFVMREGERIAAAISIEVDEDVDALPFWDRTMEPCGELARLAVRTDCQGKGLARQLLAYGMEQLKARGCRGVRFLVNRGNVKAIRSYAVFGFHIAGECTMFDQPMYGYEKLL